MKESTRRELGVSPETFLWLTIGSLEPQKDHEHLLRALREGLGERLDVYALEDIVAEVRAPAPPFADDR